MIVVVTGSKLEQPITCCDMVVRIADHQVTGSDVGGADGESQHRMRTGADSALYRAALIGRKVLQPRDPLVLGNCSTHSKVRCSARRGSTGPATTAAWQYRH